MILQWQRSNNLNKLIILKDGKRLFVNKAFEELFGRTKEDIL